MGKTGKTVEADQCPKCGARDSAAEFCSECGERMGHTRKRGRPPSEEPHCNIFVWVPVAVRDQVGKICKRNGVSRSAFLREAIKRELGRVARTGSSDG